MNADARVVEQVVPAGNSWIICRSKSHTGRVYYFNTLTGEAAWNLSKAEIEKAKAQTKNLTTQQHINIEECPEPNDPPTDQTDGNSNPKMDQPSTSTIYNKQIINNKFPKQTPYPLSPLIIRPYGHVVANPVNTVVPLAVNAPNPAFSTNLWAVPQTHQIYIAPNMTSLVAQTPSVNVPFNDQQYHVQSSSVRFNNLRAKEFNASSQNNFHVRPNYASSNDIRRNRQKWNNIKKTKNLSGDDLRNRLSAKRLQRRNSHHIDGESNEVKATSDLKNWLPGKRLQRRNSYHNDNELNEVNTESDFKHTGDLEESRSNFSEEHEDSRSNYSEEHQREIFEPIDNDSDWLEENILVEDKRLKLNVTNLKKIAKPNMKPECWYIVADKDILLYHLNFLNYLCNSDDWCYLMVPQQVMAELTEESRRAGGGRAVSRARRAVAFLSHHLDEGYVVIGDGTYSENDTRCDYLLSCCSNLLEQNYHVILLSNDDELNAYKNCTEFPIFTVKEIKQFLTKPVQEISTDRLKPPPCKTSTLPRSSTPITITVANDNIDKADIYATFKVSKDKTNISKGTQSDETDIIEGTDKKNVPDKYETRETLSIEHDPHLTPKSTIEAAVQTDFQSQIEPTRPDNNIFVSSKVNLSDVGENNQGNQINKNINTTQSGKREIRLNRSISLRKSSNEETGVKKKQFKWRRRRLISGTLNDSKPSLANSSIIEENSDSTNAQSNDKVHSNTVPQSHQKVDDSASETSSFVEFKTRTDRLTVDETSTSGIISNSTISNLDYESEIGNRTSRFDFRQTEPLEKVMFEVTNKKMEESLRIMVEEWVSRFLQIMEEVLTQVLQRDQRFLDEFVYKHHGGGPWTILEAADSVKVKFINNRDIVDAAKKLTDILYKVSDSTGRITSSLLPSEYMEMYSHGVYMIRSLQTVLTNCEDILTAEQSLANLLSDIRNPNTDSSNNDTFGDSHLQENITENSYLQNGANETTPQKQMDKYSSPKRQINIIGNNSDKGISPIKQISISVENFKENTPNKQSNMSSKNSDSEITSQLQLNMSPKKSGSEITPEKQINKKSQVSQQDVTPKRRINKSAENSDREITPNKKINIVPDNLNKEETPKRRITRSTVSFHKQGTPQIQENRSVGNSVTEFSSKKIVQRSNKTTPTSRLRRNRNEITSTPNSAGKYNASPKQKILSTPNSAEKYNASSEQKILSPFDGNDNGKYKDNNQDTVRTIDDNFFSSLNLVKKSSNASSQTNKASKSLLPDSGAELVSSNEIFSKKSLFQNEVLVPNSDIENTESSLIRKFTNCSKNLRRETLDMDQLDYSATCDDDENHYMNDDKYYSDENENLDVSNSATDTDDIEGDTNVQQYVDNEPIVIDNNTYFKIDNSKFVSDSPLSINNNLNFIFTSVVLKVKGAFADLQNFCEKTNRELTESRLHSIRRKYELSEKAERAKNLLQNLCDSMNGIFSRETYEPERNIQSLLKNAGINDFDLNDNQLKLYRDVIGKSLEQAQILQESIDLIVTAIKKIPIK